MHLEDNIVIVIDTSNYKESYSEPIPFKAEVVNKYEKEICVISSTTGKEYELDYNQILEGLPIEQIKSLINVNK